MTGEALTRRLCIVLLVFAGAMLAARADALAHFVGGEIDSRGARATAFGAGLSSPTRGGVG